MLAVTAVGADRPGIVARVAQVLYDHGGNLEDSSMTVLGGHFAMMLLVASAAEPEVLEEALASATADIGLVVTVRRVGEGLDTPEATHVVSVYGADRPGIVRAVTAGLAERAVNVRDLTTRVLEGSRPVYAMLLEVTLPEGLDPEGMVETLREAPGMDDVEVSVHPLDVATF